MVTTVKNGESLWSIARSRLPPEVSAAQVQVAVRQLASANGLDPTARLQVGQTLTIPDGFGGTVTGNTTTADALPRLGSDTGSGHTGPLATRIADRTGQLRPLLPLVPTFGPAARVDEGTVNLQPIAGVPVTGVVQHFHGMKSHLGADAMRTLDVRFGTLSAAQFDAVKASFGGRSQVTYDPARAYTAVDFLPPALQALHGQDLDLPRSVKLPDSADINQPSMMLEADLSIGVTMNCHGTAWEAARAFQGAAADAVSIFYGEMFTMDKLVKENAGFSRLGEVPADKLQELAALDLKPGDLVKIHEIPSMARLTTLVHTAVYVGNGLFFEKPDTEGANEDNPATYQVRNETPFRLVTLDMMTRPISDAVRGSYRVEAWRPTATMKEPDVAFASSLTAKIHDYATARGNMVNHPLVAVFEQGMTGNIRGEFADAMVKVPLRQNRDGTTSLA